MFECGTDDYTIRTNIARLKELKWLKRVTRFSYVFSNPNEWQG